MLVWLVDKLLPPAIVAIIFSYVTSMFLESHRAQRDSLTDQVKSLREDLLALWEAGAEYWARDYTATADVVSAEKILLLEQDIRFRAMEVASRLESLPQSKMKNYLADMADEFTGGEFGTKDKMADPQRLARMRKVTVYLRDALLTARNSSLKSPLKQGH